MNVSQFGKVAVLFGGGSAEREVSLNSGKAVLDALQKQGVDAHAFDPKERDIHELAEQKFDRVFIVLHGRGGEDGSLQGALNYMGIPYTGSGSQGSAFAMDKVRSKYLFLGADIPTAPFVVVHKGDEFDCSEILERLNDKVMVKPANEGSSIGMSEAHDAKELQAAIGIAFQYDEEVLIEQWITGKEVTVTVIDNEAFPVIEMRTPHQFYDYDAKYLSGDTEYLCPAPLSSELTEQLQQIAARAFKIVGAKSWGRVDIMIGDNGDINVLEVNTVPGMTETSLVPKSAAANGMNFDQLVLAILADSM